MGRCLLDSFSLALSITACKQLPVEPACFLLFLYIGKSEDRHFVIIHENDIQNFGIIAAFTTDFERQSTCHMNSTFYFISVCNIYMFTYVEEVNQKLHN
jgi:hypothetical protein